MEIKNRIGGEHLTGKLTQLYRVRTKDSMDWNPFWKVPESIENKSQLLSMDEVEEYLSTSFCNLSKEPMHRGREFWVLEEIKNTITGKGLILKFYGVPHPDGDAGRNPEAYPKQYLQMKITPVLKVNTSGL